MMIVTIISLFLISSVYGYDDDCPHFDRYPLDVCILAQTSGDRAMSLQLWCDASGYYGNFYNASSECGGAYDTEYLGNCTYESQCSCGINPDGSQSDVYGNECATFTVTGDDEDCDTYSETMIKNMCIQDGDWSSHMIECGDLYEPYYEQHWDDPNCGGCREDDLTPWAYYCDADTSSDNYHYAMTDTNTTCGHAGKYPLNMCVEQNEADPQSMMFFCNDTGMYQTIYPAASDCTSDSITASYTGQSQYGQLNCADGTSDYCNYVNYWTKQNCQGDYFRTTYVDICDTYIQTGDYPLWQRTTCDLANDDPMEDTTIYYDEECTTVDHICPNDRNSECTYNVGGVCNYLGDVAADKCNTGYVPGFGVMLTCDYSGQTYSLDYYEANDCSGDPFYQEAATTYCDTVANGHQGVSCNCEDTGGQPSQCSTAETWLCDTPEESVFFVIDECMMDPDGTNDGTPPYQKNYCDAVEGPSGIYYYDDQCELTNPLVCDPVKEDVVDCTWQEGATGVECGNFGPYPLNLCQTNDQSPGSGSLANPHDSWNIVCSDPSYGNGTFTVRYYNSADCDPNTEGLSFNISMEDCMDNDFGCYCPASMDSSGCDIMQDYSCDAEYDGFEGWLRTEYRVLGRDACYDDFNGMYFVCDANEYWSETCNTDSPTTAQPTTECIFSLEVTGTCMTNTPTTDPTTEPSMEPTESPSMEPTTTTETPDTTASGDGNDGDDGDDVTTIKTISITSIIIMIAAVLY